MYSVRRPVTTKMSLPRRSGCVRGFRGWQMRPLGVRAPPAGWVAWCPPGRQVGLAGPLRGGYHTHPQRDRPAVKGSTHMATGTTKQMTADEFFAWVHRPENRDRSFELERGDGEEMSRPGERHGVVCANVTRILGNFAFQRRKGYPCCNDTGVIVERGPDTVRGPDVAFFDETRRFEDLNPKFTERVPCLVVEVLSPEDRFSKVQRRLAQFLRRGTPLVWVVDPEDRTVTVYRPGELPQVLEENEELTGNGVLADLRCRVADFYYMPDVGST